MPPLTINLPRGVSAINPFLHEAGAIIPNWLLSRDIGTRSKILYGRLRTYANKEGHCWPSVATLAADLGLSERSIYRSVVELKDVRLLWVIDRKHEMRSSVYIFLRHPWMDDEPGVPDTPVNPPFDQVYGPGDQGDGSDLTPLSGGSGSYHPPSRQRAAPIKPLRTISGSTSSPPDSVGISPTSPPQLNNGPGDRIVRRGPDRIDTTHLTESSGGSVNFVNRTISATCNDPLSNLSNPPDTSVRSLLTEVTNQTPLLHSSELKQKREKDGSLSPDLSAQEQTGKPTSAEIISSVLEMYDDEFSKTRGRNYVSTKRDEETALEVWECAGGIATRHGPEDPERMRQRILRHWCRELARSMGYAESKSHGFWLLSTIRTDLGLPFNAKKSRREPAVSAERYTPPGGLTAGFKRAMAAMSEDPGKEKTVCNGLTSGS